MRYIVFAQAPFYQTSYLIQISIEYVIRCYSVSFDVALARSFIPNNFRFQYFICQFFEQTTLLALTLVVVAIYVLPIHCGRKYHKIEPYNIASECRQAFPFTIQYTLNTYTHTHNLIVMSF